MFFTEVKPERIEPQLTHGRKIWTIGSCFSDEIGRRMAADLFDVRVNPCGTLYNPMSIARTLDRIIDGTPYTCDDLFLHNGLWHCMDFHSAFSRPEREEALAVINRAITTLHNELPRLDRLMITFGSARAFIDRTTGAAAGNCHKLPADRFDTVDLSVPEIINRYTALIGRLRRVAPDLNLIFTVSPIRHKAYGFHVDKLSKSRLLIATEEICRACGCAYFPSYEVMTDELRDYRFYDADMIHPSAVAADHIYRRLAEALFSPATQALAGECRRLTRRLIHRSTDTESEEYRAFAAATRNLAEELAGRHPQLTEVLTNAKLI